MNELEHARYRSGYLASLIYRRTDNSLFETIKKYNRHLNFGDLKCLMVSERAWSHTEEAEIDPKFVFAHPDMLRTHPEVSQYYRGMALLSRKQVQQLAVSVSGWEDRSRKTSPPGSSCEKVARLYNAIVSSIIEGSSDWTLDNGYRNILATMGIGLDGMFRNKIGQVAEQLIKRRISGWVKQKNLVVSEISDEIFTLSRETIMRFGSEPDVQFERNDEVIATVEIKGGRDPAGALERLGAMRKSFAETPVGCVNFLVAGVVTAEMENRLRQIGLVKVYLLDEVSVDGQKWEEFVLELFHHGLRLDEPNIDGK